MAVTEGADTQAWPTVGEVEGLPLLYDGTQGTSLDLSALWVATQVRAGEVSGSLAGSGASAGPWANPKCFVNDLNKAYPSSNGLRETHSERVASFCWVWSSSFGGAL